MKLKEKTTATLLIAIFMISTLSVISVGAYTADEYKTAVLDAADRLVETQNPDGGFMWKYNPPGPSGKNTLGITAMGILKGHELLDKTEYETALAEAYGFAYTTPECLRFPDVTFLIGLAEKASDDTSLLAAIASEVTGTTVQSILDLAEARWNARLTALGSGDPAAMALSLMGSRPGKLAFWDLEAAVKAALALEPHFTGYEAQALTIAGVMYDNLQLGSTYYFDIEDTSTLLYTLALSGAIEGFSELGVYPTMTRTMTDLLIDYQDVAGYWDQDEIVDPDVSDKESVQTTAYAVMALLAQGDEDAIASAKKGGDWLVSTQNTNGGWYPGYVGATLENLEVDSEAAWAIARARFMVRAIGHFTTNFDYLGSGTGHRCFINLHARQVADGWTGKGVFRDKDYIGGELKAVFTVESTTYEDLPSRICFKGTADVYIDKEYIASYVCEPTLYTTSTWKVFSFQIPYLGTPGYYAFVMGADISVEMTLKVLD